ncbi:hypothetical protein HH212_00090 [Massilia forsythiae]|uniref:Uncharacterized protein n=1 Tax=Massilia forsythiae TaxID=2728020 RepID=A0A7Z2VT56_9BURK|nr:hypothetical protein [Massilia forsythiae]QJD98637.1 hypothetical protein HH212_00090 [Massilia forsythiae]
MAKRVDLLKESIQALTEAVNLNRENPSRYTSEGYLKPLCAPDKHKPFRNSMRCEVCGLVVRGEGANLATPPAQQ